MKMLITGGSGFLGRALSVFLAQDMHKQGVQIFWVTQQKSHKLQKDVAELNRFLYQCNVGGEATSDYIELIDYTELKNFKQPIDLIINLAGAGIADKRWTDERKHYLLQSRLQPTQAVLDFIAQAEHKPKLLISGSAIGWYGASGDVPLSEQSGYHDDFSHQLCQAWEDLAFTAPIPTTIIRTGVVLDVLGGGMLAKLLPSFKLGLGGKLGDGQQIMSWIALQDWIRAVSFIIQRHENQQLITKVYNLTAPKPVTNAEFTQALGRYVKRPTLMTVPAFTLKLALGEMSTLLLDGQKVLPKQLLDDGFVFLYDEIGQYLSKD
ncbi:TIGR01777 family oxidoreductase [Acinetobacter sp. c2-A9]|uniref:TIGR01777 family oxidoreductase n=1 Tax=Acinetobacter sp. c2-A9 TaxID=3342802 RepID=UPI0035BAC859